MLLREPPKSAPIWPLCVENCKRIDFESPVWCLIARDGTFPKRKGRAV
jgi:hypothetical protein